MLRSSWRIKSLFLPLLMVILLVDPVGAQNASNVPTRGKRFWTGFMQNGFAAQSLRVHIMSTTATSGTVSIPMAGWSTTFTVAANGVAVITVPANAENTGSELVQNKGVLIQAQDSVNVFISSFQNFTHDNSQVLPESSIGDRYRVDAYHGVPGFNNLHKSELLIVATQDGTEVRIVPSVATAGGNPANVPFTVALNAGQTYQVQAAFDHLDLTGTMVEGTENSGECRPFAVYGGSMCANIPSLGCSACDHIFEQLMPLNTWGTRYYTVPVNGVNGHSYRILANENNTSVTIGTAAPIILNAGQKHEVNSVNTPVCIQASKPVSVSQLLEGIACAGSGDPSMVILSPHDRVSTQASFHTPTSNQLNQHSISLVVPPSAVGQVTLNGNVISPSLFQDYAGCADRKHAKLAVTAGVHRVASTTGFQLYMFGLGSGESYAASVNDINAQPMVQDSLICGETSTTLNAPGNMAEIQWVAASDPATVLGSSSSLTITPSQSDSYIVSGVHAITGCPMTYTYHVGVPLTIPTVPLVNGSSTAAVCQYEQVQLSLSPPPDPDWFDILWSPAGTLNDPTLPDPIATPVTDTWYKVMVNSPTGCGSMVDSVLVTVSPGAILEMQLTASPASVCLGGSTTLTSQSKRVIASDQFNAPPSPIWAAIQGGIISQACGSVSGSALYFNGNGLRSAQTVGLNTMGGGQVRFHLKIADGVAPCADADPGENVVLEYSTSSGMSWTLIATYLENAYPIFTPIIANIPAAAQTNNTMFRIRQVANSGAGHDNWAIDDFLVARNDNNWLSYQWTPGNTVANPTSHSSTATPTSTGWYTLHGTDPTAGCVYTDSVHVTVLPPFVLHVTPDTTLCAAAGLQLNATPTVPTNASYTWTPNNGSLSNASVQNPMATPQTTTTYTVNATSQNGCVASGSVTVTVGQLLDLDVSVSNDTICQGQQVQLQAVATGAGGLVYSWTPAASLNNSTISDPIATPGNTTIYTCTVTDPLSGCSLTESVTIHVATGYTADAGNDLTLCTALGHQLNVQHNVPNAIYQWSPGANLNSANIQSPTILNDVSATYTVIVTDANGCSVSDQLVITRAYDGVPSQVSVQACMNTPPELQAPQPGGSYSWSNGQTTPSITATNSGAHTVTVTNAQGCQAVTTFNVQLHAIPVVDLGPDVSLCGATSHTLNAGNAGSTFNWNPSGNTQTITVTNSGTYQVTVTNANGCSASNAVLVQFNALPVDVLDDMAACITTPPTLDAGNAGSTFEWSTGEQQQTIMPTMTGNYSVTITTPQNCSATYSAYVELAPEITVDLGNDTTICQGQQILLSAGVPGATYEWNTLATTASLWVNTAGNYSVTVSNGYCSAYDVINIQVDPAPINNLSDATLCIGETVLLDAGNDGSSYEWNTSDVTRTIEVLESGTYTVIVTNAEGCSGTFNSTVQFIQPPVVDLGPDTALCEGQVYILDAGIGPAAYTWNTGAASRYLHVTHSGTYEVTVNNGYCSRSDMVNVHIDPAPVPVQESVVHICLEEEPYHAQLDAGNTGSRFLWSTGEITQMIGATDYGLYHVLITNAHGCTRMDSVQVFEYCPSTIFAPNTFTPNGDGLNDVFLPVGRNLASMELMIFDRWGTMIFQTNDMHTGWDGTYRGQFVKDDIYVWRINYRFLEDKHGKIGMPQEMMGHIQVLR